MNEMKYLKYYLLNCFILQLVTLKDFTRYKPQFKTKQNADDADNYDMLCSKNHF